MFTALVGIGAGLVHGINEGMDMYKEFDVEGVRHHPWFTQLFYHLMWCLEAMLLIWFGHRFQAFGLFLIPMLILANRVYEMAYGFSRSGNPFPDYENFLGAGASKDSIFHLTGVRLRLVQILGTGFGLALLILWR